MTPETAKQVRESLYRFVHSRETLREITIKFLEREKEVLVAMKDEYLFVIKVNDVHYLVEHSGGELTCDPVQVI